MIKVVLLNGTAGSGKDYFVEIIRREATMNAIPICHLSTIRRVKECCEFVFSVKRKPKTDAKRLLWHKIKAAWSEYTDGPFVDGVKHIDALEKTGCHHIVFLDVREPGELKKFKDYYGDEALSVLIQRRNQPYVPDNPADQNVESFQYDLIIQNDGTELFNKDAVRFLQRIAGENGIKIAA